MKNPLNSTFAQTFTVAVLMSVSLSSFAAGPHVDRTTEKARTAVENASPDDWYTLARAAQRCIEKGVNLKEAACWLDQSLAIREHEYNLIAKGDYYMKNRLPEKALECYSKSIRVAKLTNPDYMNRETQDKIVAIVKQLG